MIICDLSSLLLFRGLQEILSTFVIHVIVHKV